MRKTHIIYIKCRFAIFIGFTKLLRNTIAFNWMIRWYNDGWTYFILTSSMTIAFLTYRTYCLVPLYIVLPCQIHLHLLFRHHNYILIYFTLKSLVSWPHFFNMSIDWECKQELLCALPIPSTGMKQAVSTCLHICLLLSCLLKYR